MFYLNTILQLSKSLRFQSIYVLCVNLVKQLNKHYTDALSCKGIDNLCDKKRKSLKCEFLFIFIDDLHL